MKNKTIIDIEGYDIIKQIFYQLILKYSNSNLNTNTLLSEIFLPPATQIEWIVRKITLVPLYTRMNLHRLLCSLWCSTRLI